MSESTRNPPDSSLMQQSSQNHATLQMHIDQVISLSKSSEQQGSNKIAISAFQQYVSSKFRQLYPINEAKTFLNDVFVSISFHSLHNDGSLYLTFASALIKVDIGDKSFKANRIAKDLNNLLPISNNKSWETLEQILLWLQKQLGTAMNVTVNMLRDKMIAWFAPSDSVAYLSSLHILYILIKYFPISITNILGDAEKIIIHSIQSDEEPIRDLGCKTLESALSINDTSFHFMCISISHLLFSETNAPSEGLISAVYSVIKSAPAISNLFTFAEAPIERLAKCQSTNNFKLLVLSYRCTPSLFTDEDINCIMSLFLQFLKQKQFRKMTLLSIGEMGFLSSERLQEESHKKDVKCLVDAIWPKNVNCEEAGFALLSLMTPTSPNFADQFNAVLALPLSKLILEGIRKFIINFPTTAASIRRRMIPLLTPVLCDLKDRKLTLDLLKTMIFMKYTKDEMTLPLLIHFSYLLSIDGEKLNAKMADLLIYFQDDYPVLRFRLLSFVGCSQYDDLRISVLQRLSYSHELCELYKSLLNDRNSKLALETMRILCESSEKETIRSFINDSIIRFPFYDSTRYRHLIKMYLFAANRFIDLFEPICDIAFNNFLQVQLHFPASLELIALLLRLKPHSDRRIIEILETHLKFHSTLMILKASLDLLLAVVKYTDLVPSQQLLNQVYEVSKFAEDQSLQAKLFHVISHLAKISSVKVAQCQEDEFGVIPLIYSLGSRDAFISLTYASVVVSLNLLFEIVGDDSLVSLHFSALEALIKILKNFRNIGEDLSEILVQKMNIFISNSIPSTVSLFLNNFSLFAMVFGEKMKTIIPHVIEIICKNWGTLDISLLLRITEWIIMSYQQAFRPFIFKVTNLFISDLFARPPEAVNLIFSTFVSFGPLIKDVHSIVVPSILEWIDNTNADMSIINDILMKLRSILLCLNDRTYGLAVLRTLSFLIQRLPENDFERIMDIFCLVIVQMKSDFMTFYPEFARIIEAHQTPQLNEIIQCLAEKSPIPRAISAQYRQSFVEKPRMRTSRVFEVNFDCYDYKPPKFTLPTKDFTLATWEQWIDDTATLFIQQSMSKAISASSAISEKHNHMKMSLFPIALALSIAMSKSNHIWKTLFHSIFTFNKTPLLIVRLFLVAVEFLEVVHIERPISCEVLADKASSAGQVSQSLRYMEMNFEKNPLQFSEPLVKLNQKLGMKMTANSIFRFIKKSTRQQQPFESEELVQLLGFWEDALVDLDSKLSSKPDDITLLESKLFCLYKLSRFKEIDTISTEKSPLFKAIASWNMNNFDQFKEAFSQIDLSAKFKASLANSNSNSIIRSTLMFYEIIYNFLTEDYKKASELIEKVRRDYASNLFPLLLDDYERVMPVIWDGTLLCEVEEIIQLKQQQQQQQLQQSRQENINQPLHISLSMSASSKMRVDFVKKVWNSRLESFCNTSHNKNKQNASNNTEINSNSILNNYRALFNLILVRSLYFNKEEMKQLWSYFLKKTKNMGLNDMTKVALDQLGDESSRRKFLEIKLLYKTSPNEAIKVMLSNNYEDEMRKAYPKTLCKWLIKANRIEEAEKIIKEEIFPRYHISCNNNNNNNNNYNNDNNYDNNINNSDISLSNNNNRNSENILLNKEGIENNVKENWKVYFMLSKCCESSSESFDSLLKCVILNTSDALKFTPKIFSTLFSCYENENEEEAAVMIESFRTKFPQIPPKVWLFHLPQIISMLGTKFHELMIDLLIYISSQYIQDVAHSLVASARNGKSCCSDVISILRISYPSIIDEITMFSGELIRIASCWYEIFNFWLDEASRNYVEPLERGKFEKNLANIQNFFSQKPTSIVELQFVTEFGPLISRAEDLYFQYQKTGDEIFVHNIWAVYVNIFKKLHMTIDKFTQFNIADVSPWLSSLKDSRMAVPFCTAGDVKISHFVEKITVISSKQRPRRICIVGDNGKRYSFLLKANEDTRLDERIMQFFTLYNSLVHEMTGPRLLSITTYGIIPLSNNVGLIGWVSGCQTLFEVLKKNRERWGIDVNAEMNTTLNVSPNFERLQGEKRYAPFVAGLQITKGDDIKEVLVANAVDASHWLLRRKIYTCSLASSSMVGYIIGLGDRHFGNIMMKNNSAELVHIDFGDCFEVTRYRKTFPETVPFRLTRVMVTALDAAGVDGNFRESCIQALTALRSNRKLILGVLETFVSDPVLVDREKSDPKLILNRISEKLNGVDFDRSNKMKVNEQVETVVNEAMDLHNLCRMFSGWRPWW